MTLIAVVILKWRFPLVIFTWQPFWVHPQATKTFQITLKIYVSSQCSYVHSRVNKLYQKRHFTTKRCDFHSIFATVFNLWSVCSPSSPHTISARTSNQASPFLFQHIRPKTRFCPARFCYADGFQQRAADIISSKYHRVPPQSFYCMYSILF